MKTCIIRGKLFVMCEGGRLNWWGVMFEIIFYRSFVGGYFQDFKLDIHVELLTVETITNFCYLFSSCGQQALHSIPIT